jgi:hypothetical protein
MGKIARECGFRMRKKTGREWWWGLVKNGHHFHLLLGCWEDEELPLRSGEERACSGFFW